MAAILPRMEEDLDVDDVEDLTGIQQGPIPHSETLAALSGFGAKDPDAVWAPVDPAQAAIEATHANQTRFVWNRALVEEALRERKFWMEARGREYVFKIDPPIPADLLPWKMISGGERASFPLFSTGNSKMKCLTWDLPAGAPAIGGTCPGAVAAQTIVPPALRAKHLVALGDHRYDLRIPAPGSDHTPYREAATICAACYAGEGNYGYAEIIAGNSIRYHWTRTMMQSEDKREEWIGFMVKAITDLAPPAAYCRYTKQNIRPIRVHSTGDFFSIEYAIAWIHVANRVARLDPSVRFWAPTRTWALPRGASRMPAFDWGRILALLDQPNLVVRPSAYHVGDPAPGPLAHGVLGAAHGSTSLVAALAPGEEGGAFHRAFPEAVQRPGDDRAAFDCPVYATRRQADGPAEAIDGWGDDAPKKPKKPTVSCESLRCRVCWTRPDLSVNYTLH